MTLCPTMFDVCKLLPKPATGLLARRPIASANGELAAPVLHPDNVRMGIFKALILLTAGYTSETSCRLAVCPLTPFASSLCTPCACVCPS